MKPCLVVVSDLSLAVSDIRMRRSAILYSEIAREMDVTVVTRASATREAGIVELAPGLIEQRVPRTAAEMEWQSIAHGRWGKDSGDDCLWFERVSTLNPPYMRALEAALAAASLTLCVRPYAYAPLRTVTNLPIVYDALELEYPARAAASLNAPNGVQLLETVARLETACVRGATMVITGDAAAAQLGALMYNVEPARFLILANAVDRNIRPLVATSDRQARKATTNLAGRIIALLVGSRAAVRGAIALTAVAAELPEIQFFVAGRVAEVFPSIPRPQNLHFSGSIDNTTLTTLLDLADVFVNPAPDKGMDIMRETLDAAAHGVPLVLTPEAAGGIFCDGIDADVVPVSDMASRIRALLADPVRRERQSLAAHMTAQNRYPWSEAAAPILDSLVKLAAPAARE